MYARFNRDQLGNLQADFCWRAKDLDIQGIKI